MQSVPKKGDTSFWLLTCFVKEFFSRTSWIFKKFLTINLPLNLIPTQPMISGEKYWCHQKIDLPTLDYVKMFTGSVLFGTQKH